MKLSATSAMCMMFLGLFGCSGATDDAATGASDDALKMTSKELTCDGGSDTLAVVVRKDGKPALVSLTKAGHFFAVTSTYAKLATASGHRKWTGTGASLDLGASLSGTWERDGQSIHVTCKASSAGDAASFRAALALTDYADEIDGLAASVLENSDSDPKPKPYTVFAVATSDRGSLALGQKVADSQGELPGVDDVETRVDDNDLQFGAMSAAYALGGGEDYAEWFQGASDGISLLDDLKPSLKNGAQAEFVARKNVTALASLVDGGTPSAVEFAVGEWTFYLPGAFPK